MLFAPSIGNLRPFMSGDEGLVFLLCGIWVAYTAIRHGAAIFSVRPAGHERGACFPVLASWLIAASSLWLVLATLASHDVRDSAGYTLFYLAMGLAWVSGVTTSMVWLDWHFREDVLERNNRAAAMAQSGAVLGMMSAFAGANIGDGPGWPVVIICAILSTGAVLAAWLLVDRSTHWIAHITVDRDLASGLRAGAFFLAAGLIAGRAVAGDWMSFGETMADFFRDGVWLIPLAVMAGLSEHWLQPTERRPRGSLVAAVIVALIFLAYAFACLIMTEGLS